MLSVVLLDFLLSSTLGELEPRTWHWVSDAKGDCLASSPRKQGFAN